MVIMLNITHLQKKDMNLSNSNIVHYNEKFSKFSVSWKRNDNAKSF